MLEAFIYEKEFYINKNGIKIELPSKIYKNDIETEIRDFLLTIENQVISGIKINKMYLYDNIELYNFCRGSIYDKLKELLNKYILIESLLDYFDEEIEINTDDLVYKYIAEKVFFIKCNFECSKSNSQKSINVKFKNISRIIRGFKYILKIKFKNKEKTLFLTRFRQAILK